MGRRVGLSALHNSVFVRHIRTRQLSIWSDENVRELNSSLDLDVYDIESCDIYNNTDCDNYPHCYCHNLLEIWKLEKIL